MLLDVSLTEVGVAVSASGGLHHQRASGPDSDCRDPIARIHSVLFCLSAMCPPGHGGAQSTLCTSLVLRLNFLLYQTESQPNAFPAFFSCLSAWEVSVIVICFLF